MTAPQTVVTPNGPAITHSSDFIRQCIETGHGGGDPITFCKRSWSGTRRSDRSDLSLKSSRPVNSPVQVTINGNPAEVLGAVGYPGSVDGYQVNFQVPSDAAKGLASVQVTAEWIAGAAVNMTIQ